MLVLRLHRRPYLSMWMTGMLLPKANDTYLQPTQSFDVCHRQGLLLVTAQRGRQTTACHG